MRKSGFGAARTPHDAGAHARSSSRHTAPPASLPPNRAPRAREPPSPPRRRPPAAPLGDHGAARAGARAAARPRHPLRVGVRLRRGGRQAAERQRRIRGQPWRRGRAAGAPILRAPGVPARGGAPAATAARPRAGARDGLLAARMERDRTRRGGARPSRGARFERAPTPFPLSSSLVPRLPAKKTGPPLRTSPTTSPRRRRARRRPR